MHENEQDKIAFRDKEFDKNISPFTIFTKGKTIVWPPIENECADINMFFHNRYPETILFDRMANNIYISANGSFFIDSNNMKKVYCYCENIKCDTKIIEYKRGDFKRKNINRTEEFKYLMDVRKQLLNRINQTKEDILRIEIKIKKLKEQKIKEKQK